MNEFGSEDMDHGNKTTANWNEMKWDIELESRDVACDAHQNQTNSYANFNIHIAVKASWHVCNCKIEFYFRGPSESYTRTIQTHIWKWKNKNKMKTITEQPIYDRIIIHTAGGIAQTTAR